MPRNFPSIEENVMEAVIIAIKHFQLEEKQSELTFPSSLTSEERSFVHQCAYESHLKSKSVGKGANRFVTVFRPVVSTVMRYDAHLGMGPITMNEISNLIQQHPVQTKERNMLMPQTPKNTYFMEMNQVTKMIGTINTGIAYVPPVSSPPPHLLKVREELPINNIREEIINSIIANQVLIVSGETGSGKTTQVPQFILEHCHSTDKSCRIICAQPRGISAVAVSERVAAERGEAVGLVSGYKIHLESKISPCSLLTVCTYRVLLRSLMVGDAALSSTTHIIVDEVHERDYQCDLLLLVLRDMLARCRGLRLIVMSSSLDTALLTNYFRGAALISVPGRIFDVKEYFLEDILKETGYVNKKMAAYTDDCKKRETQVRGLALQQGNIVTEKQADIKNTPAASAVTNNPSQPEKVVLEKWLSDDIDWIMERAWDSGKDEYLEQLLHMLRSQNVSLDYQHSATSTTILMIAAAHDKVDLVEMLLDWGARPEVKACNNFTALDWAVQKGHHWLVDIIQTFISTQDYRPVNQAIEAGQHEMSEDDRKLVDAYQSSVNDEHVDLTLLVVLLTKLHASKSEGAILVFLPDYDHIMDLHDRIKEDKTLYNSGGPFRIFVLHSNMQTCDQRQVFTTSPPNERKIILSTNIAETSIAIDDVVFVIDAGKVIEKSYDATEGVCMLRSMWVSKASCQQRRGRAGRTQPGFCYHLCSRQRYLALQQYQTPEILRLPLQELCLQTKMLAPFNTSIADFLAMAPEPPPTLVTKHAVNLLKLMDALTPCEDLTDLGQHLIDLPIEPRLGKALLFAVILRCLDPALTIICTLACKELFTVPSLPENISFMRLSAYEAKRSLAAGTYSDHMSLLRVFQLWQDARIKSRERQFCEEYGVSAATLEMVMALRSQLLGQLKASGFVSHISGRNLKLLNENSGNWAVIKAALTAGVYPNLARLDRSTMELRTQNEAKVAVHPSSVLSEPTNNHNTSVPQDQNCLLRDLPSDWLLYEEMSRVGRMCNIRTVTLVSPITVFLFAGSSHLAYDLQFDTIANEARSQLAQELDSDSEAEDTTTGSTTLLKLDDWTYFRLSPDQALCAVQLRQKLHSLFIRKLRRPSKPPTQRHEQVLRSVVNVLTAEEKALMLPQPPLGIQTKPKTFEIGNLGSCNMNEAQAGLDREAKLVSPLEACLTRNSDSGSNLSSERPCLSPTPSNNGSGASSGEPDQ